MVIRPFVFFLFSAGLCAQQLKITGDVPRALTLTTDDLAKMPRETVSIPEEGGAKIAYEGVQLREILKLAGMPQGHDMRGKALATYIVAKAHDGYQVVFTPGEMDPEFGNESILVADKREGKPLFAYQGPFRLVVTNDKAGARGVRMLEVIEVVRLKTAFAWELPKGFPVPKVPASNPMTAEKVELGRYLFYDKRLSVNGTQACASCHQQSLAFTDGKAVGLGATGEHHQRGPMSLVNVAYSATLTWNNPDMKDLEEQALVPMFGDHPVELGLRREDGVPAALKADPKYRDLFARAFSANTDPFTIDNLVRSIAFSSAALFPGVRLTIDITMAARTTRFQRRQSAARCSSSASPTPASVAMEGLTSAVRICIKQTPGCSKPPRCATSR